METLTVLRCDPARQNQAADSLKLAIYQGAWVYPLGPEPMAVPPGLERLSSAPLPQAWPSGPGLVMSTGGSSGSRSLCLHPIANLDRSADSCGRWLAGIGLEPGATLVWNPLPLHHVSGLMPWWRVRRWGAEHSWLSPALMRQPERLLNHCRRHPFWRKRPMVLSLVPTQLRRLLSHPAGCAWLRAMDVIWVGGAALPADLADQACQAELCLAPCYGATETAAMVTALTPVAFLAGTGGCGSPLPGVHLRLVQDGALAVQCDRLAVARLDADGGLSTVAAADGWWRTGDAAEFSGSAPEIHLRILGRLDGAIQSGGVTVFPGELEERIRLLLRGTGLPIDAVLLLGVENVEWGERLVGLVRWTAGDGPIGGFDALRELVRDWPAAERPMDWIHCPDLQSSPAGKWERSRWQNWLASQQLGNQL